MNMKFILTDELKGKMLISTFCQIESDLTETIDHDQFGYDLNDMEKSIENYKKLIDFYIEDGTYDYIIADPYILKYLSYEQLTHVLTINTTHCEGYNRYNKFVQWNGSSDEYTLDTYYGDASTTPDLSSIDVGYYVALNFIHTNVMNERITTIRTVSVENVNGDNLIGCLCEFPVNDDNLNCDSIIHFNKCNIFGFKGVES